MKKAIIISSLILVISIISLAMFAMRLKKSITFDYRLSRVNIMNVITKNQIDLQIDLIANNSSNSEIMLNNLKLDVYYKQTKITTIKKNTFLITSGTSKNTLDSVVYLNKQTGEFGAAVLSKANAVPLTIRVRAIIYFIPVYFTKDIVYDFSK